MIVHSQRSHYSNVMYVRATNSRGIASVYEDLKKCVISWLWKKCAQKNSRKYSEHEIESFTKNIRGYSSRIYEGLQFTVVEVQSEGKVYWGLRLREMDKLYPKGRSWNTRITISQEHNYCTIFIEIVNKDAAVVLPVPTPSMPSFIITLLQNAQLHISGDDSFVSRYSELPYSVSSRTELITLSRIINHRERKFPIIAFYGKAVFHTAKKISKTLLAKSVVVYIQEYPDAQSDIIDALGENGKLELNQFRIFYPRDLERINADVQTLFAPLKNPVDEKSLLNVIYSYDFFHGERRIPFFNILKMYGETERSKATTEPSRATAPFQQSYTTSASGAVAAQVEVNGLQERILKLTEMAESLRQQIGEKDKIIKEQKDLLDLYVDEEATWQDEKDAYKQKILEHEKWRNQHISLQEGLKAREENAQRDARAIKHVESKLLPQAKGSEMLEYFGVKFEGKVVFCESALKSADETGFDDRETMIKIAESIGTVMYQMRFIDGTFTPDNFKRETGYEIALTESSGTNNDKRLSRMRQQEINGKKFDFSKHIKAQSDGKYFRAHFDFDKDDRQIVVWHFGNHMETAGTSRMR